MAYTERNTRKQYKICEVWRFCLLLISFVIVCICTCSRHACTGRAELVQDSENPSENLMLFG